MSQIYDHVIRWISVQTIKMATGVWPRSDMKHLGTLARRWCQAVIWLHLSMSPPEHFLSTSNSSAPVLTNANWRKISIMVFKILNRLCVIYILILNGHLIGWIHKSLYLKSKRSIYTGSNASSLSIYAPITGWSMNTYVEDKSGPRKDVTDKQPKSEC